MNISIGTIVVTKDFESLFKVANILDDKICGFDVLNYSKYVCVPVKNVLCINNKIFFQKILSSDYVKSELSSFFAKNIADRSKFLGVSERTLHRMIYDSEFEYSHKKTSLLNTKNPDQN